MIRVREVAVILDDGEALGTIPTEEAIAMAEDRNLDLVEVAPIYDTSGLTSLTAANLVYEMLCVLPGVSYRD